MRFLKHAAALLALGLAATPVRAASEAPFDPGAFASAQKADRTILLDIWVS